MNRPEISGSKPPAVPRRTQSTKVVNSYKSGRALRATNENEEQESSSRQPTRRWSQKNKTRRSLDAMEKQADDLYDFLSDLESRKASCSDTDFLSFLSESKDQSSANNSKQIEKSPAGLPSRTKRMSVKDKAKLFLQSDIKEEPVANTSRSNKPIVPKKPAVGSGRFTAVNQRNNNNNNNNSGATKASSSLRSVPKPNTVNLRGAETAASTRASAERINEIDLKPEKSTLKITVRADVKATNKVLKISKKNVSINGAVDCYNQSESVKSAASDFIDAAKNEATAFSAPSDSEPSSEESDSLSEAELSLEHSSRSTSSADQRHELENDLSAFKSSSIHQENRLGSPENLISPHSQRPDSESDRASEVSFESDDLESRSPHPPADEDRIFYSSSGVCF